MSAINGVRKSSVVKKQGAHKKGVIIAFTSTVSILATALVITGAWKLHFEEQYRNNIMLETSLAGQSVAYRAIRDIAPGENISGAIEQVDVPGYLTVGNAIQSSDDINDLRASGSILANSIITTDNCFNPETQDVTLSSSRQIQISGLNTPGVSAGDYIDIRIKQSSNGEVIKDDVVCSKKQILSKDANNNIGIMVSEAELLNLNSALAELSDKDIVTEVYTVKYVDPANQPKSEVTYVGNGSSLTASELLELQKSTESGENEYSQPTVEIQVQDTTDETVNEEE